VLKTDIGFFLFMTLCCLVVGYQLLPRNLRQFGPLKHCYPPGRVHGIMTQKTTIWITG